MIYSFQVGGEHCAKYFDLFRRSALRRMKLLFSVINLCSTCCKLVTMTLHTSKICFFLMISCSAFSEKLCSVWEAILGLLCLFHILYFIIVNQKVQMRLKAQVDLWKKEDIKALFDERRTVCMDAKDALEVDGLTLLWELLKQSKTEILCGFHTSSSCKDFHSPVYLGNKTFLEDPDLNSHHDIFN